MSTEQIYKGFPERYSSLQRDHSVEKIERTKFKIKRRLGQLENKACFFEGQLNPITIENKALKDKLVQLNRAVSASSDLLRNLLPVQNDPTRKLKLQIATLEEISAMIKEDWLAMKQEIYQLKESLREKEHALAQLEQKHVRTIESYQNKLQVQKNDYEAQVASLKACNQELSNKIEQITLKAKAQKEELINSYTERLKQAEQAKKQFQKYVHQMNEKCQNYERVAQRLRDEIAHNLLEFQKSKENIKEIYEGLMQSKLDQQNKEFQYLLKIKEDEKMKIMEQMAAAAEELKKKISEKNSEINHLSGLNDKLKEEIGATKDQIWQHKIQLDKCHKDLKQLSEKLYFEEESNRSLKLKIEENQTKLNQVELRLKKNKEQYEKEIMEEKAKVKQLEAKIVEERQAFEKKAQESETKLQEFKRKLRENDQKFQERLEEEKRKFEQRIQKYEQEQKQLREQMDQSAKRLREKQQQITKIIKNNEIQMRKMEEMNEAKMRKIQGQYESKMKRITYENEQKIKQLNKDHQLKMSELEISSNEYVRKLMADHSLKLYESENKYKELQQTSQKKLKELESSLNEAIVNNKKLQDEYQQISEKFKRAEEEHKKILEEQRKQSERRLEMEKEKFLNQMREQVLQFKKAMDEKEESFLNQLSQMKQSLEKQIKLLKQTNAIESVQQKYNDLISKLKDEMAAQAKRMEDQKREALEKAAQLYNNELVILSKKLQFDISKLNEELLHEKESHQFDKMTREEKINFLILKINGFREQMAQKDNKIYDLYFQIDKKNKQLQKIDQIVAERTKKIKYELHQELLEAKEEFELQAKALRSECQAKVKKIETERIEFTQSIYNEFQDLKAKYDQELGRVKRKYDELEKIFEERPSRAEDLSKIKELIEEKSKMDLQIKECKKKVKEANEIVKYLNLELENYKQTYDIFGPGGEPLSPEKRYYTETDSPIRSLIRRQTIASEDSEKNYGRDKRATNESPDLNQFRLFPPLGRNTSEAVMEEDDDGSEPSNRGQYQRRKEKPMFNNRVEAEDKSEELKNNASVFLGLISREQRLPIEMKSNNKGYSKRMSRRKTIAVSYDKKLQIKDKTLVFEQ